MDVTDDKKLPKAARKQAQIDHAAHISEKAKLVKLADKISNLRDVLDNSPADWSLERRQEYFDWAHKVIDQIRGTHTGLEALFDEIYAQRPV
jgi:guanosine-3',5'-bis(diphosphate) 3'-pyrophosphohydrolase